MLGDGKVLQRKGGAMGCHLRPHLLVEISGHPLQAKLFALKLDDEPIAIGLVDEPSVGIDTPEDYCRFVERWHKRARP